jgi:hypothetical protein
MLASPAVVSHMNARSPFWRGIGPGLPGGVRPGSGSWAGSSWSLARGGGCPGCRPSILMAAVGARGQHQTRCSCRWSMPPSSRTRSASPSGGRWSPTPRPSGPVGSCPRRTPPGCMATTAAPRSCAGGVPGECRAAGHPLVSGRGWTGPAGGFQARRRSVPRVPGGWALLLRPRRWPAACLLSGAVGESGRPAWPPLLVGPSDRCLRCPPGRCVGGAAGGGCVPWPGRRPRPLPRSGGP